MSWTGFVLGFSVFPLFMECVILYGKWAKRRNARAEEEGRQGDSEE